MSLKVFQLAKELGVESKAIIAKCQAEGVPDIIKHTDAVKAGLALTIREWFAAGELKTAIETTEHVDLSKQKKTSHKRGAKKGAAVHSDEAGDSTTAVAEPPTETEAKATERHKPARPSRARHPETAEETSGTVEAVEATAGEAKAGVDASSATTLETAAATAVPPAHPPTEAVVTPVTEEVTAASTEAVAVAGTETRVVEGQAGEGQDVVAEQTDAVVEVPVKPVRTAGEVPQKPIRPLVKPAGVMNVPNRPLSVAPVGPQVKPSPAQMQGPRVVRVDKPDNLPAPRPRPAAYGGGGGQYNRGPGMSPGQQQGQGMGGPGAPPGFGGQQPPMQPTGLPTRAARVTKEGAPIIDDEEAAKKKGRTTRRGPGTGRHGDAGQAAIREWRELDLQEREERLAQAAGALRDRKREMSKQLRPHQQPVNQKPTHVEITPPFTIRQLAEALEMKSADIVRSLMKQGTMATVNQNIEAEAAQLIALELGIELVIKPREALAAVFEREYKAIEDATEKVARPPVVTILGHVDHGKTSLLDKIRSANVAAGEAGGITQHVGAYTVALPGSDGKEKRVTFLDTPGHQAFTSMRARGANMTDVVVLVVSADDGVMPQTIESIAHAKAAGVPIVVAMNKIDKPEANPNRVLGQLAEHGLNPTEWGGDVEVVKTSAVTGQGVKELIEYLDYVATLRELKASPQLPARGAVIESFMDPNRGVIARVLVQNGTLKVGDTLVCGAAWGRVRSLTDDKGRATQVAPPATPVEVIGLNKVPAAGDRFFAVKESSQAQEISEERFQLDRAGELAQRAKVTLDNLYETIQKGEIKELLMILKADVQGSVDVLKKIMTEELSKEVKVRLLHAAVGGISESDVVLAEASGAIIIGFSVVPDETARKMAEERGVEVRLYRIIYEITDDIRKALTGMLSPEKQEQVLGHADIRQVIRVSKVGSIAGCMVSDGSFTRSAKYRLIRESVVVKENLVLDSLKRFKEDAKEVRSGLECGLKIAGYDDIKVGDRLEAYKTVDVARTL